MPDDKGRGDGDTDGDLGAFARQLYRERRLREGSMADGMFGEPAWDILLDLFASEAEGKAVRVSSACIAAAVPATTALRYISEMERRGLLLRMPSATDRRAQHVKLSRDTFTDLEALLKRLRASRLEGEPSRP